MTIHQYDFNSPIPHKNRLTSDSAGWNALALRIKESVPNAHPYEVISNPGPMVALSLGRPMRVDARFEGRRQTLEFIKGTGFVIPQGVPLRLGFDLLGQRAYSVLHMVVPQETVDWVADELSRPGIKVASSIVHNPFLADPSISSLGSAAASAVHCGAPDFYAQAVAQWLAGHLLLGASKGSEWQHSLLRERISDSRLIRVLEYIGAHLSERLDLRVLAKEAGISRFHFAALFTKAVGTTPHRHVQRLRMETAQAMLRGTDKTLLDIAQSCGYKSASHFAADFRKKNNLSPTAYRSFHRL